MIAATGAPIARAMPDNVASIREPSAAGASPAPSRARPGQDRAATRTTCRTSAASRAPGVVIVASRTTGHSRTPASNAPRRDVLIDASATTGRVRPPVRRPRICGTHAGNVPVHGRRTVTAVNERLIAVDRRDADQVRYHAAVSPALRLERSGPDGVVARVTLDPARRPQRVRCLAHRRAADDVRDPSRARTRRPCGSSCWPVTGPSFCAGADIAWMRAAMALDVEGNEQDAMAMADMFEAIDTCPVPVIARVQGAALGGGMGLCAVADLVIAESGARFGFTETRLGILPAVIAPFVVAKIGEIARAGAVPGRAAVRRRARPAHRARARGRRGRGRPGRGRRGGDRTTCWLRDRRRPARRRRSSARCAASATGRRSGTPRGSSPANA